MVDHSSVFTYIEPTRNTHTYVKMRMVPEMATRHSGQVGGAVLQTILSQPAQRQRCPHGIIANERWASSHTTHCSASHVLEASRAAGLFVSSCVEATRQSAKADLPLVPRPPRPRPLPRPPRPHARVGASPELEKGDEIVSSGAWCCRECRTAVEVSCPPDSVRSQRAWLLHHPHRSLGVLGQEEEGEATHWAFVWVAVRKLRSIDPAKRPRCVRTCREPFYPGPGTTRGNSSS